MTSVVSFHLWDVLRCVMECLFCIKLTEAECAHTTDMAFTVPALTHLHG